MPSRKREKGRARKLSQSQNSQTENRINHPCMCTHGLGYCPCTTCESKRPSDDLLVNCFLKTLFGATFKESIISGISDFGGAEVSRAIATAHEKHPEVLPNDTLRGMAKALLVSRGCELLLRNDLPEDVREHDVGVIEKLGHSFATPILLIESYDPSKDCFTHVAKLKHKDIFEGCPRSVVQFFSKRAPCNCLDEKYAEMKLSPKTGMCDHCTVREYRYDLLTCAGCSMRQYCSQECQQADWPFHETYCEEIKRGPTNRTAECNCYRCEFQIPMSLLIFSNCMLVKRYSRIFQLEWGILMCSIYCFGVIGVPISLAALFMVKLGQSIEFTVRVYNDEVTNYMFSKEALWYHARKRVARMKKMQIKCR